jgi:hypothetical protein
MSILRPSYPDAQEPYRGIRRSPPDISRCSLRCDRPKRRTVALRASVSSDRSAQRARTIGGRRGMTIVSKPIRELGWTACRTPLVGHAGGRVVTYGASVEWKGCEKRLGAARRASAARWRPVAPIHPRRRGGARASCSAWPGPFRYTRGRRGSIGGEGELPDGVGSGPGGEDDAVGHPPCLPSRRCMCEPGSRGLLEELPSCS